MCTKISLSKQNKNLPDINICKKQAASPSKGTQPEFYMARHSDMCRYKQTVTSLQ